jgi:abequosyltransferase
MNSKLSIAIPTYNRSEILGENLRLIFEDLKRYSIPVYISDDSTNDSTRVLVEELVEEYPHIFYVKNMPSLGHDLNCLKTLSMPSTEYIWYLNDSAIIVPGALAKILKVLNTSNHDFMSFSAKGRKLSVSDQVFSNANDLLVTLGWHLTQTGCTIYSKRCLKIIDSLNITACRNFPQTAIIFESFAAGDKTLLWLNDSMIEGNEKKKSYWNDKVFDIFLGDWNNFVMKLPAIYSINNKKEAVISHSINTRLFSFTKLKTYRSKGVYNLAVYKKFKVLLVEGTQVPKIVVWLIAVFPRAILNLFLKGEKSTNKFKA